MKPTFIGIGAQKCASSWIYKVLEDHPQVGVSNPKEIDFFSNYYINGFQWYEKHFASFGNVPQRGEISPSYLHCGQAPERLKRYLPEAKIILTLRDPIERAFSNHQHEYRLGHINNKYIDFEKGIENNPMYLEQSLYAKHLSQWLYYFPMDQIHVVFQENIKRFHESEAKKLYNFLDIDSEHTSSFLNKKSNASYVAKNKKLDDLIINTSHFMRKNGMGGIIECGRKIKVNSMIQGINRTKASEIIPQIQPKTDAYLTDYFSKDVSDLAKILGGVSIPWDRWFIKNK